METRQRTRASKKASQTAKKPTSEDKTTAKQGKAIDREAPEAENFHCGNCSRPYATKSGLAKHLKSCGSRDRTKCQYCGMAFTTYTGVRLHEIRSHPNKTVTPTALTDAESYELMAHTEVRLKKGEFINIKINQVTGLTKDQIRHRRAKAIYKDYLAKAQREFELETGNVSSQLASSNPTIAPPHTQPSGPADQGPHTNRGQTTARAPRSRTPTEWSRVLPTRSGAAHRL